MCLSRYCRLRRRTKGRHGTIDRCSVGPACRIPVRRFRPKPFPRDLVVRHRPMIGRRLISSPIPQDSRLRRDVHGDRAIQVCRRFAWSENRHGPGSPVSRPSRSGCRHHCYGLLTEHRTSDRAGIEALVTTFPRVRRRSTKLPCTVV